MNRRREEKKKERKEKSEKKKRKNGKQQTFGNFPPVQMIRFKLLTLTDTNMLFPILLVSKAAKSMFSSVNVYSLKRIE